LKKREPKLKAAKAVEDAKQKGLPVETQKKFSGGSNSNRAKPAVSARKLEDEEDEVKIPKVDRAVSAAIAQGRAAVELNQKEFALKINEPVKVVVEYEQGKAIPSQAILVKMEKVLGIKLRGKDIGAPLPAKK